MDASELDILRDPAVEEPYRDQWELMRDQMSALDYRFYLFYKYHQWLGPENDLRNMLGLVVTREEFEHNLTKAAQTPLLEKLDTEERDQLEQNEKSMSLRLRKTVREDLPLLRLFDRFQLDVFEQRCVTLAYAVSLDAKYEKICAYLQDDITQKLPSIPLAAALLTEGSSVQNEILRFDEETPFTRLFNEEQRQKGKLSLEKEVLGFLNDRLLLPPGNRLFEPSMELPPLLVQQEIGQVLDALFTLSSGAALLSGSPGSGRRFQIQHLCRRQQKRCLFVDLAVTGREPSAVSKAGMLARLTDSCLCLCGLETADEEGRPEPPPPQLAEAIARLDVPWLFLLSEKPLHLHLTLPAMELELPPLRTDERLALFETFLQEASLLEQAPAGELASKFHFTPLQIRQAVQQVQGWSRVQGGSITDAQLHQCCYRQVVHKLDTLASQVRPAHRWEDLVLPEPQKRLLRRACAHVRYQHQVYSQWGFDRKVSYGRGVSILFAGAPGTGKTLCAQIMAAELNMEMYKINISQIVSKYIGETEKNLQSVFREARHSNCILFFDECDALFGKRGEVKDSHDRNANVETAYLLQQIEEYDGVCILATNLLQNIDEAFLRRITFVVHFPFPDTAMRKQIYQTTIPADAPLGDDIDWDFLADKFQLSGGYIKNIVVSAAFMAAQDETVIGMRQLLNAAVNELKKNEIVVVRESLREYADLLET